MSTNPTSGVGSDVNDISIPSTCKAGCVESFGPDFQLVVKQVPVPEPGKYYYFYHK
jgi:hypothetical protein